MRSELDYFANSLISGLNTGVTSMSFNGNEAFFFRYKVWGFIILSIMRKSTLRWYGYVIRREETHWLQRILHFLVAGRKPRRRPRKTWGETITEEHLILPTLTQLTGKHGEQPSRKWTVQPHRVGENGTLNEDDDQRYYSDVKLGYNYLWWMHS